MSTRRAYVATLGDLAEIALKHPAGTDWPPPGMQQVGSVVWGLEPGTGLPTPLYVELVGDDSALDPADVWWTTVAQAMIPVEGSLNGALAKILRILTGFPAPPVSAVAQIPLIFHPGKGTVMRWIRNTVRGQFGGGTEQWQFKVDFGTPGADPDYSETDLLTFATAMRATWGTWWTTMAAWYPAGTSLIEVGAAQLVATEAKNKDGSGGNVESTMTQWAGNVLPYPAGSSPSPSLPFEVALAVALQTDHRGPSGRGRFYAPAMQVNAMDDGLSGCFEPGVVGTINAATKAVFDTVRAAGTLEPVVVSERRLILNTVTSLATGIVPDSQRRRRRSQDEARVVLLTPA